jgi:hypothetical protein
MVLSVANPRPEARYSGKVWNAVPFNLSLYLNSEHDSPLSFILDKFKV